MENTSPVPPVNPQPVQPVAAPDNPVPTATPPPIVPGKKPSTNMVLLLGIIVAVFILLIGGFVLMKSSKTSTNAPPNSAPTQSASTKQSPSPTLSGQQPQTTGNTDAALDQDSQSIDNDLNALNADVTSVDQSLNDQQTNLQ